MLSTSSDDLFGLACAVFLGGALSACSADSKPASSAPQTEARVATVDACAERVIAAFEARSGDALAAAAHPVRGIRFTPFGFVRPEEDVVLDANALRGAFDDDAVRDWGNLAESDERIRMKPAAYFERFVLHPASGWEPAAGSDAASYEAAAFDVDTLESDLAKAYPHGHVIQRRRPPSTPNDAEHDGAVLRVVCEAYEGAWYTVGIVHSEWTP
ncbi:hypothetical protein [Polyangium sp. 15x6]|uniref:hypothetical protein n=1 Tax=Polyangium sp. 15x6 TaxID=3042687 RepID=UPI00249BAA81|nr:hypothetical protein [Polyangium sp. 15x6]MDI3288995.1 hypothetical protein [Polyangium sp. 15x6]